MHLQLTAVDTGLNVNISSMTLKKQYILYLLSEQMNGVVFFHLFFLHNNHQDMKQALEKVSRQVVCIGLLMQ